jgi:hypothetical protein
MLVAGPHKVFDHHAGIQFDRNFRASSSNKQFSFVFLLIISTIIKNFFKKDQIRYVNKNKNQF